MDKLYYVIELIDRYFKNENGDLNIYGKSIKIILVIILVKISIAMFNRIVNKTFKNRTKGYSNTTQRRANTLRALTKSLIKYFFYFIGIITVLDIFNINTRSILATAGIGGLAIGFGAQSLVKDIITGFFILLEDQYAVGDYVGIGSYDGVVEELGIRVTKLRDFSGELHIIPNGNIQIVTNKTRGAMRSVVDVGIAYEEDINNALEVLNKTCEEIRISNQSIIEGPEVQGVADLADTRVVIRIVAKTQAMDQWEIEREIRKKIKEDLEKAGIEIPYPRMIVLGGREDDIKL